MDQQEISIRWASDPADVKTAQAIRERVFCGEQGVSRAEELDGRDEQAVHLLALEPDAGRAIGTLRMLFDDERAKIGRVAVEAPWRRGGIASRMLLEALQLARQRGCAQVRLSSQQQATGLYERAGFTVQSDPFLEAGIAHVWMALELDGG